MLRKQHHLAVWMNKERRLSYLRPFSPQIGYAISRVCRCGCHSRTPLLHLPTSTKVSKNALLSPHFAIFPKTALGDSWGMQVFVPICCKKLATFPGCTPHISAQGSGGRLWRPCVHPVAEVGMGSFFQRWFKGGLPPDFDVSLERNQTNSGPLCF